MGHVVESSTQQSTEPTPPPKGGRGRQTMRDMLLSMVVLAVVILILAAITHSCSFSPGGPTVSTANLPSVDVSAELGAAAGQVRFPLRRPTLPADWRPNSDSEQPIGTDNSDAVVYVGWLTGTGRFLQLAQSNASVTDLVHQIAGADVPVTPQGQTRVGDATWTVYSGVRDEQSWVRDLGPVRLLITGNADAAEFSTLAAAAQSAPLVKPSS
jgi:hypothetical protein